MVLFFLGCKAPSCFRVWYVSSGRSTVGAVSWALEMDIPGGRGVHSFHSDDPDSAIRCL